MKPLGIIEKVNKMEEMKNEILQETVETQDDSYKSGSVQYIDSREVAEMVGKKHTDLIRDIKRYKDQISEINQEEPKRKIAFSDFFIASSYNVEGQSRSYPCYLVTKKGCEFIAHKLTGVKGTKFTATYINRFHEMENALGVQMYEQMIPLIQQFMEKQEKFNQVIMGKLEKLNNIPNRQNENITEYSILGTNDEENEFVRRRRMLNQLVGKMAKACEWDRNFALHRLYKTLESALNISLDEYLDIYQDETFNDNASTLEMVIAYDRLYRTAVKICTNTINSMKCL